MNAKVEEFINKMKEEKKAIELKQKEEHLISLGLVDEKKSINSIQYRDMWDGSPECKYDEKTGKYYKGICIPAPIEVTNEEWEEILKYAPITPTKQTQIIEKESKWAGRIQWVAIIFAIINTLDILVLIFGTDWEELNSYFTSQVTATIFVRLGYYLLIPVIMGFSKIVAVAENKLGNK